MRWNLPWREAGPPDYHHDTVDSVHRLSIKNSPCVGIAKGVPFDQSEEGSYLRLVDVCITQLYAESNKEEEEDPSAARIYLFWIPNWGMNVVIVAEVVTKARCGQ